MWSRLFCLPVALLASERAWAQDLVAQFYHGKQITIIVGSSAGGGSISMPGCYRATCPWSSRPSKPWNTKRRSEPSITRELCD